MTSNKFISSLSNVVEQGLYKENFPYVKNNDIYIKNYVVRNVKECFIIMKHPENMVISKTNFKSSALAIAKTLSLNKNCIQTILEIDRDMLKHYNDVEVFKHTIKHAADPELKQIREDRLNMSLGYFKNARKKVNSYIFNI